MNVSPIRMPQLGESVTEGTVDRWLKKVGDFVKRDEPLVEVVSDKVNAEIPSPFEGKLIKISVSEGTTVAIGTEIAQIEVKGAGTIPDAAAAPASPVGAPPAPLTTAPATSPWTDGAARGRFSPAVRRLAEEHGIDPATVSGTGEGGRVTRDDVLARVDKMKSDKAHAPAGGAGAAVDTAAPVSAIPPAAVPPVARADPLDPAASAREELVRLSAARRSIAEHMVRSARTAPHVWTLVEVDMSALVRYREAEKEAFRSRHGVNLTYVPFVAQILCEALHEFPFLNSTWTDDGILVKKYVNLGLAMAVPPDGLMVPVVKDADLRGFTDLARAISDLAERARSKHLKPEDVQGGTFTLNNTGAAGSIASQPIINQPQAAILTTELIMRRPVVIGEGIAIRYIMNMCMSFDHRILDGRMAGLFVNWIKGRLEEWTPAEIKL